MEIRRLLYSIIRKWWLIVFLSVFFGVFGFYLNVVSVSPMYSADTTLYVLNRDKVEAGQALSSQDLNMSQALLRQYSGIFYSRTVTSAAARTLLNYNISQSMLASMVSLSSKENSNVLMIRAIAPDPQIAAAAANAMGRAFTSQIRDITKSDFIGILDEALVPTHAIPNNGIKKTIIWIIAGVIIALGIIYLLAYFDTTVRFVEDIENGLQVRVLGIIPEHDIR